MRPPRLAQLEARYTALRQEMAGIGYLSDGSVYRRPAGQPGTRFTWSTKVKAKTVSLALSADQADWLEQAIAEHRRVKKNSSPICAASPAKSCAPSFLTRNDAPP